MPTSEKSPYHVDNLSSVNAMERDGFVGFDASLRECLFCYGFAWRDTGDEWLFVYGIRTDGDGYYSRFDRCTLSKTTDAQKEWNWANFGNVAEWSGMPLKEWLELPFPELVYDLARYYGNENVFGTSYWEGFAIAD